MSDQIGIDVFKKELFDLLEETFSTVQGIYLDRGTSLYETLDTISSDEASRPVSETCASIAAQVNHVRFYLDVLLKSCFQNKDLGKINWEESWQMREVTTKEWEELKKELRKTHQNVLKAIETQQVWQGEDDIGASLAILAHTAYHLGEIRQALCTVRLTTAR